MVLYDARLLKEENSYWYCLQCFDAVGWGQEGHPACKIAEWWVAGMVSCLGQATDLHMAQLMPLPLTVSCCSKIEIGFRSTVLSVEPLA